MVLSSSFPPRANETFGRFGGRASAERAKAGKGFAKHRESSNHPGETHSAKRILWFFRQLIIVSCAYTTDEKPAGTKVSSPDDRTNLPPLIEPKRRRTRKRRNDP